ncbi:methyl-accepting chemotaxis protein [Agrobacterium pusense]|uniref:methyl-accepting chemotaxis protein n=1 Tax=Agrobacterium pusense TaxID=648995 RepID=UPI001C6EB1DC|nr:methyl-accepting chemotaxis protein [Agrobacterium pusense]MBW9067139.1 methyl-accepting chemotaxis protein [Agrobacterium pusense]MBW9082915.1 methyl-accepting chemotaxis protein [Agrobacterium pusense]MBW9124839.1 methyl-accepting chemotaxis protein [Agrobacterium pusense]MBW9135577.1 methyl-accepting chemotaxis protein [Agrobacterium pusense]
MIQTIRAKLTVLSLTSILSIFAISGVGYYGFSKLEAAINKANADTIPTLITSGQLARDVVRLRMTDAQYVTEPHKTDRATFEAEAKAVLQQIKTAQREYEQLSSLPKEPEVYREFQKALNAYLEQKDSLAALVEAGETEKATVFFNTSMLEAYKHAIQSMQTIIQMNKEAAKTREADADAIQSRLSLLMALNVVGAVLVAAILLRTVLRSVLGGLNELSRCLKALSELDLRTVATISTKDEIGQSLEMYNSTLGKLKHVIAHTKESANTVSAASIELSSTMDHLTGATRQQESALTEIASAIEQTSSSALAVKGRTEHSVSATNSVSEEFKTTNENLKELQNSALGIEEARGVIQDITDQINLLALNAAIEAARAGDAGRGFAVVADEVRKLASSTGISTQQITERIARLANSVEKISQSLSRSVALVDEISNDGRLMLGSVTEQTAAIEQISSSMQHFQHQMNDMARSIGEARLASSGLSDTAVELSDTAIKFNT